MNRPYKCCACSGICGLCDCCNYEIAVETPQGVPLGFASSTCYCCSPTYAIYDANHAPALQMEGPCCFMPSCPCGIDFDIYSAGDKIGKITKQWTGITKEVFSDADNFGVQCKK